MNERNNIRMGSSNLAFYMGQQKVTVEELSRGTGISVKAIYRYRIGEQVPGLLNAWAISRYLKIKLELLWCIFDKN